MTIVSHQTIADDYVQDDGKRGIRHEYIDHLIDSKPHIRGDRRVPDAGGKVETEAAYVAERIDSIAFVEADLATQEVQQQINIAILGGNPDKVPDHQTQADFDRRFLGESMLLDAQPFFNCKPVFDRVALIGNTNARAAYISTTRNEFLLVEARYNNVNGVAWFLDDEKNMRWIEPNEAFI